MSLYEITSLRFPQGKLPHNDPSATFPPKAGKQGKQCYNSCVIVTPIKTHKITPNDCTIDKLLDQYLPTDIPERSVVAVTSKIVSICGGRVVKVGDVEKEALVAQEAEWYLPLSENLYGVSITIKNNVIIASAGIDESNGNGYYVLWPENPQQSANEIRRTVREIRGVREVGVIVTDSRLSPLRWGVTGVGIAHSGFQAVNDMIGKPDIFGRPLHVTKVNIMDGLAASGVFVMGESSEQTPLAIISDIPHIVFQDHDPTEQELNKLKITMKEDIFAPILKRAPWKTGKKVSL